MLCMGTSGGDLVNFALWTVFEFHALDHLGQGRMPLSARHIVEGPRSYSFQNAGLAGVWFGRVRMRKVPRQH